MVLYRRNFVPGGTFFFTVALADRASDRLTAHIEVLRKAFRAARVARPFEINAIVVLPEHMHAIFTLPDCDQDFATRWRLIKSGFTRDLLRQGTALRARDKTGVVLWQRRYWEHTIRGDEDYARHVDYIHYNPVKHGMVACPIDWPFSSLRRYVSQGVLARDWGAGVTGLEGSFGEPGGV